MLSSQVLQQWSGASEERALDGCDAQTLFPSAQAQKVLVLSQAGVGGAHISSANKTLLIPNMPRHSVTQIAPSLLR